MIATPAAYDEQQIARALGDIRLRLPRQFREELDNAIDRGLSRLPKRTSEELKNLVAASVALTLRASDFANVLEDELERQRQTENTKAGAKDWERLNLIKNKFSKIVGQFESVALNRRTSKDAVQEAYESFLLDIELLDNMEADPLRTWAIQLFDKRQKLRGAA